MTGLFKGASRVLAVAALLGAGLVAFAAPAAAQSAPFTAYGMGLEAGSVVEAFVGSRSCGTAEVDADGEWLLYIVSGGPCRPTAGAMIRFEVDGRRADATVEFEVGGAPEDVANGIMLEVEEGGPAGPGPSDVFSAEIVPGVNLVSFTGGNVEVIADSAPDAKSVLITVKGKAKIFIVGAPAFVNKIFLEAFPDGGVPDGTLMVVVSE